MNIADLEGLYMPQDYISKVRVNQVQTAIPIRTPAPAWFVRTHPHSEYWSPAVNLLKRSDGYCLVHSAVYKAAARQGTLMRARLATAITKQGLIFLWVINQRGTWRESAMKAAELAKTKWVQVKTAKGYKGYATVVPEDQGGEPRWTDEPFNVLVERAFQGRILRTLTDMETFTKRGRYND